MCGIIGYIGTNRNATAIVLDGLSKVEYRGYDSVGIGILQDNSLLIRKKNGRLADLIASMGELPPSHIGIGHTRWATHGVPSDHNAHPHSDCTGKFAVVHNGIIENYSSLRKRLVSQGHDFTSDTDTEVIGHLLESHYQGSLEQAVRETLKELQGSFALAIMCQDEPDKLIAVKKDMSLVVGLGEGENYVTSDIPAILGYTNQVYILEDYELAVLTADDVKITNREGQLVNKEFFPVDWDPVAAEKGGYEHFMLKEIHEQPVAVRQTLQGRIKDGRVDLADLELDDLFQGINKIYMVACGTAYHAGMVGRLAIEKLARIPVETDIASEFRYRDIIWKPDELMIVISQSGETADTLSALRYAKRNGIKVLAVTNVVGSSVAREADKVIYTHAGPEIAVASTKAYTTQLVIMYLLALYLAQERGTVPPEELRKLVDELASMDEVLEEALQQEEKIKAIAARYTHVQHTFFLGRGFDNAVAMEGALKLKETSYIHAEAYAAGELKHGPLALISDGVPVLTVITQDSLVDKTMSNIKEVKARGAVVIAICKENLQEDCQECDEILLIPNVNSILAPVAAVVPLQTFAYYMSVLRGNDVDKPRNLAKSVTVE
ncbi:MAG: glutamine--fructose-6-phosphate transaminase (isomerizing) [Syntrophomonadaceae bacterium]|jgi:glucosamine--fructose-6-phosphate aminotransferase (isomerizing)|nr:glutamine--fructose-6-phosphate transaminase (isomerizing) [Bacillota bacterium]NLM88198.1 glutamine--fructose-6-phosphate transaminase (isomerizing) [Syntrophomonadaceae bacterium]HQA50291.1 glutamine--fructose-6-phosphate transaminase (isomerizing) [Syntrophomonadaceae bacterium]HQD91146.1 glutamine--fructose-6-phosphate transaminase (isomerizing) [Syntrophomonadaceae bacterium]